MLFRSPVLKYSLIWVPKTVRHITITTYFWFISVVHLSQTLQYVDSVCFLSGTTAKVTHVYVDPCKQSSCILHKGTNSTISVAFIPTASVPSVKALVHGVIAGIPIPFPISGDDGCINSGLTCPLKPGVEVKYAKAIPVSTSYPSVSIQNHVALKHLWLELIINYVSCCLGS